jgi:pyrroline-5-carboxylate reductase
MTMTFIGGGNMATALIGGMLREGANAAAFRVVEPYAEQRDRLAARFPGVGLYADASADALRDAAVVVLAVKPQQMQAAATALAPHLDAATVVLSIAAGIRLADLGAWLGGHSRLVRAMPNTPALIGRGISGVYAAPDVDAAGHAAATAVLAAAGEVLWVDNEAMLDAVTGISGSGPAYVFYFLEAMMQAGRDLGFAPHHARKLAYATFTGALALAEASEAEPATLRAQVTSKGGTTERAISSMEEAAVKAAIVVAVKAAAERAREMGDAFGASAAGGAR